MNRLAFLFVFLWTPFLAAAQLNSPTSASHGGRLSVVPIAPNTFPLLAGGPALPGASFLGQTDLLQARYRLYQGERSWLDATASAASVSSWWIPPNSDLLADAPGTRAFAAYPVFGGPRAGLEYGRQIGDNSVLRVRTSLQVVPHTLSTWPTTFGQPSGNTFGLNYSWNNR